MTISLLEQLKKADTPYALHDASVQLAVETARNDGSWGLISFYKPAFVSYQEHRIDLRVIRECSLEMLEPAIQDHLRDQYTTTLVEHSHTLNAQRKKFSIAEFRGLVQFTLHRQLELPEPFIRMCSISFTGEPWCLLLGVRLANIWKLAEIFEQRWFLYQGPETSNILTIYKYDPVHGYSKVQGTESNPVKISRLISEIEELPVFFELLPRSFGEGMYLQSGYSHIPGLRRWQELESPSQLLIRKSC